MDEAGIDRHYGAEDVWHRIEAALVRAGRDPDRLEREHLTGFDEFHGGGIASTRDLAQFAALTRGMRVLDVGCGIGGPARTLAAEFGCRVTGVDLTVAFVRAATELTRRVGMADACRFVQGSAVALPFEPQCFDAVWSQNMMMNVEDKAAFFAEVFRVLEPGGTFAFEAVVAGNGEPVVLPAFWAARPEHNFLVTYDSLERLLETAGLARVALEDTTAHVIEMAHKRRAALASEDPAELTIAVIVPDDVQVKMANALLNNVEGRTRTVRGVYHKPD